MSNSADIRFEMLPHLREACLKCKMCELGWNKAKRHKEEYDPHVFSNFTEVMRPPEFMLNIVS